MSSAVEAVSIRVSSDSPHGRNTRLVEVAGTDITRFCRSVELKASIDELVSAKIEMLVREGFDLQVPAGRVDLTVVAMPGFVLIEERADGQRRWRVEREPVNKQ